MEQIPVYNKKQNLIHRDTKYTGGQRGLKLQRKWKVNKTYGSVPKKTGTKIYRRTERNRREEPDTATSMVGK